MTTEQCLFDGECENCSDFDFNLIFDDGSELKAHRLIIQKASSVLKQALTECSESVSLNLQETYRDVWLFILRCLYPSVKMPNEVNFKSDKNHELVDLVLVQADKYNILYVLDFIEQELLRNILQNEGLGNSESSKNWFKLVAVWSARYQLREVRNAVSDRAIGSFVNANYQPTSTVGYPNPRYSNSRVPKRVKMCSTSFDGYALTRWNATNGGTILPTTADAATVLRTLIRVDDQDWRADLFDQFLENVLSV